MNLFSKIKQEREWVRDLLVELVKGKNKKHSKERCGGRAFACFFPPLPPLGRPELAKSDTNVNKVT